MVRMSPGGLGRVLLQPAVMVYELVEGALQSDVVQPLLFYLQEKFITLLFNSETALVEVGGPEEELETARRILSVRSRYTDDVPLTVLVQECCSF